MAQISLKKLFSKKEGFAVIQEVVDAIGYDFIVQDAEGKILIGVERELSLCKYPVELSGEVIGWVIGEKKASTLANLLSYLAKQELEKKTLAHEVLDKYREITLLYEISNKIAASLELKEVTKLVLEEARRLIRATSGSVMLLNEKTGRLDIISSFGKEWESKAPLNLGEGIVGSVMLTGRGEIVNDVFSDPRYVESQPPASSLMCVPLKSKEKAIGAIAISSLEPVTYTAADLKLLSMLASQGASAIENALLHEHQLQESRREALLFRLASQIRQSLDLDTILENAVSEIRNVLQIDRCLFIWDRSHCDIDGGGWEVVQEAKNPEITSLIGWYAAPQKSFFTQKLLEREIVRIDDVETLSEPLMQQFFRSCGLKSVLALPIQTRSGEIGVLSCASSTEQRPWSDREVELLQAVANKLALALDQAELYKQSATAALVAQAQAQRLQQALDELKQTQAQLIHTAKMSSLGELVADVAHEINNPINFIYGNLSHAHQYTQDLLRLLQAYQKHYPPNQAIQDEAEAIDLDFVLEDLPKLLSSMKSGAERIRQIVLSLRNFSRIDQAQIKTVDIHEGIDNTLLLLQNRLKHPTYNIEAIKEYSRLPKVELYSAELNQVFMNIISNAIDALDSQNAHRTPGEIQKHPSRITIRTLLQRPDYVTVQIADNGPGIPEHFQGRLFDPFFTTKPVGQGTGLGLTISYQIVVKKHGGALWCISQQGHGTEFWIEIPVRQRRETSTTIISQAALSESKSVVAV